LAYVDSSLLPDEQIVYKATLRWTIFWQCWLIILIGIASLIFQPIVGGLIIFVGLLVGLRKFIEYKTSEFAVTTKRVIIKVGVFRRRTLELLLRQVEAISVEQTVLGRMLGFAPSHLRAPEASGRSFTTSHRLLNFAGKSTARRLSWRSES